MIRLESVKLNRVDAVEHLIQTGGHATRKFTGVACAFAHVSLCKQRRQHQKRDADKGDSGPAPINREGHRKQDDHRNQITAKTDDNRGPRLVDDCDIALHTFNQLPRWVDLEIAAIQRHHMPQKMAAHTCRRQFADLLHQNFLTCRTDRAHTENRQNAKADP